MNQNSACSRHDIRVFRASLRLLVRKISRNLRDDTTCCGVGFLPCHVLLELEGRDGVSLRNLQEAMETDKAALSRTVDALVRGGLATREQNPRNRRTVVISLTRAGREKVAVINEFADKKYRRLFRLIPAREQAAVVCAVDYLAKAFDELESGADLCAAKQKKGDRS